ncbi:hypothetical protein HY483_00145 [Candidatus Woesearchaeota archaeon]|nr:hypothetical protein [Candidatus Woesearchaeota archaeon]
MDKEITKEKLLKLFEHLDKTRSEPLVIVAIGGTALSLLGLKEVTEDIDFIIESRKSYDKVDLTVEIYNQGYKTEIQEKGIIVVLTLPADYVECCSSISKNASFKNLRVLILSPVDIIITKMARFIRKDRIDITKVLLQYKPSLQEIEARFQKYLDLNKGQRAELLKKFGEFKKLYTKVFT